MGSEVDLSKLQRVQIVQVAPPQTWFTVEEAAAHLRQSVRQFNRLDIPAHGEGARKVYHRESLDAWMLAHPWQVSTPEDPASTSDGGKTTTPTGALSARLQGQRLRPYKPRKKQSFGA